jgi:tetratricopeptide (TPR) repeat protein
MPTTPASALTPPQVWRASADTLQGWVVRGLFAAQVRDRLDRLERQHRESGTVLLVLDPTTTSLDGLPLSRVMEAYLGEVGRHTPPCEETLRLAQMLFGERGNDGLTANRRNQFLARLWTLLARRVPATLVVLHADRLGEPAADQLANFVRRVFSDPIASLAPQVNGGYRVAGTVVFVGEPRGLGLPLEQLGFETVDAQAQAPSQLRAYLRQPDVLERLVQSTAGSVSRLRTLLDELPDKVEDLLMHRFERLDASARDILEVLALACRPVPSTHFDDAAVRQLVDEGFVRRQVDGTRVRLFIDEPDFRSRVVEQLAERRRTEIHLTLGAMSRQEGDEATAIYHALHTDDATQVVDEALDVAGELVARGDVDEARALLDAAQRAAGGHRAVRAARLMVELERAAGNPSQALARLDEMMRRGDECASAELALLRGELLLATGDHGPAAQAYTVAAEQIPRARVGLAEAFYLAGKQAESSALAYELLAELDREENDRHEDIVRVRNLCGKLAIFDEDYATARLHFERVDELARRHGLRAAECRAQANLGIVAMQTGASDEARDWLAKAVDSSQGNPRVDRAGLLLNLGMLEQRQGRFDAAFERYVEAIEWADQAAAAAVYYTAAYNLATLYQDIGAFERALTSLEHIDGEPQGTPPLRIAAWVATARAGIYFEMGDYRSAVRAIERARDRFEDVDHLALHGVKERLQAAIAYAELGQNEAARAIVEGIEQPVEARNAGLHKLARALSSQGDGEHAEALKLAAAALHDFERAGYHHGYCRAAALLVSLYEASGRLDDAYEVLDEVTGRIHGRADKVPDTFRDDYFDQPIHRRLLGWTRTLGSHDAAPPAVNAGELPSSRVLAIAHEILDGKTSLREQQRRLEHECIRAALERTEGNITRAAELLQLNRSRLSQIINADEDLSALKQRLKG